MSIDVDPSASKSGMAAAGWQQLPSVDAASLLHCGYARGMIRS